MENDELLNRAEENVKEPAVSRGTRTRRAGRGKAVVVILLLMVLAAVAWNSWNRIKEMNTPPDLPRDVMMENMGGYLFVTVMKLNAWMEREGTVPETEEEFLGWDDPAVEYGTYPGGYSVTVLYSDTALVWHSGDDPSEFLTEGALERMGVTE